jgi:hypothetical protein
MAIERLKDPVYSPEEAAHEVIVELCKAQVFGYGPETQTTGRESGAEIAEAIIGVHEKLTEYYKTLKSKKSAD